MACPVRSDPLLKRPTAIFPTYALCSKVVTKKLCWTVYGDLRRWQVVDNRVKERLQVGQRIGIQPSAPFQSARVDDGKVGLFVVGAQIDKEVKGFVYDFIGPGRGSVNFVDYNDNFMTALQRLAQNKARLWHGALDGIGQQHDAVDHIHDALHLAAKIGVPGRVDNINGDIAVDYARVLLPEW